MEQIAAAVAEAHHRIANSLALLASLVRLQARACLKEQALTASALRLLLDGIAARLNAIARLHRLLSQTPPEGDVALKPHLGEVCQDMIAAFSSPERPVRVACTGADCQVPVRHIHGLDLILCEIFINALKYARPGDAALILTVDCVPADGRLLLTVSDNGAGLPEGFDPAAQGGLGFRVIRSLAGEIGASLEIAAAGPGLGFRLSLPAAPSGKLS